MRFCAANAVKSAQLLGRRLVLLAVVPVFTFCGPVDKKLDDKADDQPKIDFIRVSNPYSDSDHKCNTHEEQQVVSIINDLRVRSGTKSVECLLKLTDMANAHATYLSYNQGLGLSGHDEMPGRRGFRGANLTSRAQAAGIDSNSFWIAEGVSWGVESEYRAVSRHIRSVYHRSHFLTPGSRYLSYVSKPGEVSVGVFNSLAWVDITGLKPIVFPPDNSDNVPTDFDSDREIPDPMHGYDRVGYPVSVHFPRYLAKDTQKEPRLLVRSFKLFDERGKRVSSKIIKPSTDSTLFGSDAYIVPYNPLSSNVTYTVEADIVYGGFRLEKSWKFTTGSY